MVKKNLLRKVVVQIEGMEAEFIARSAWSRDLEEKIKEFFQESFEEEVDVSLVEMPRKKPRKQPAKK